VERIWSGLTGIGLLTILEFVLVVVALLVAPRNRRPSSALAWILLIALLPIIGILLFALIGSPKLPRHRRDKQQHMDALIIERGSDLDDVSRTPAAPPWLRRWLSSTRRLARCGFSGATTHGCLPPSTTSLPP
jgi:cardiolipin synthase A/B